MTFGRRWRPRSRLLMTPALEYFRVTVVGRPVLKSPFAFYFAREKNLEEKLVRIIFFGGGLMVRSERGLITMERKSLLISQKVPVHPAAQLQVKRLMPSAHCPPLRQGKLLHSLMSVKGGKTHNKDMLYLSCFYPLRPRYSWSRDGRLMEILTCHHKK